MPIIAACPNDIIDVLAKQPPGTYTKEVLKYPAFHQNWWYMRVPKKPYPEGMGPSPLRRVAARQRGGEVFPFRVWRPNNGIGDAAGNIAAGQPVGSPAANACCPPTVQLNRGYLNKGITTFDLGWVSRDFCRKDFTQSLDPAGDLMFEFEGYSDQITQSIASFQRNEFIRLCTTKIYSKPGGGMFRRVQSATVGDPNQMQNAYAYATNPGANPALVGANAAYLGLDPTQLPTSVLDQDLLSKCAQWLDASGIAGITKLNGAQNYELVTSQTTGDNLLRDATNATYFEYADMGKGSEARLLGGLGQSQQFRNIVYRYDVSCPRLDANFNFVPAFLTITADSGTEDIPNPAWFQAPYEISILYTDEVYDVCYPAVPSKPGGNVEFGGFDYVGNLVFNKYPTNVAPAGDMGFFYSEIFCGSWAGKQRYAAIIISLNCGAGAFKDCNGVVTFY